MTRPTQPEQHLPFYALTGDEAAWDEQQRARWDRVQYYAMYNAIAGYIGHDPSDEVELSMEQLGVVKRMAQTVIDWHRTRPLLDESPSDYIVYLATRDAQAAPASGGTAA